MTGRGPLWVGRSNLLPTLPTPHNQKQMSRANKEYLNTILSDVSAHVRAYSADENRISTAVVLKDSTLLMV